MNGVGGAGEATGMADEQERGREAGGVDVEVTFSTFVLGLSTQALMLLGEIADPAGDPPAVDLGAAKQLIDIVGLLEAKTKGNLDATEQGLIESVLYDLRMRYVEIARRTSEEAT